MKRYKTIFKEAKSIRGFRKNSIVELSDETYKVQYDSEYMYLLNLDNTNKQIKVSVDTHEGFSQGGGPMGSGVGSGRGMKLHSVYYSIDSGRTWELYSSGMEVIGTYKLDRIFMYK